MYATSNTIFHGLSVTLYKTILFYLKFNTNNWYLFFIYVDICLLPIHKKNLIDDFQKKKFMFLIIKRKMYC